MAVYTTVDDSALTTFLFAYDLGDVRSFAGIAEEVGNSITCCARPRHIIF